MKVIDFIKSGGRVVTACGYEVTINRFDLEGRYPIAGTCHARVPFECHWDPEGYPWNLPTTHGLALMATMPVVTHRTISRDELSRM